jgi:hypothetical protein
MSLLLLLRPKFSGSAPAIHGGGPPRRMSPEMSRWEEIERRKTLRKRKEEREIQELIRMLEFR